MFNDTTFNFKATELAFQEPSTANGVAGQVTGSVTRVLGQNKYLRTAIYYDEKYRVIQQISENNIGGADRTTNRYDFVGKVLATTTRHRSQYTKVTRPGGSIVTRNFEYDHAGRLTNTFYQADARAAMGSGGASCDWTDIVGVEISGNTITATGGTGWGHGAASPNSLPANTDGWVETTVSQIDTYRMIGFSSSNIDAGYVSIDFAVYLTGQAAYVFENGNNHYGPISITLGDVLRVERSGTAIIYRLNGNAFYSSVTSSTGSLVVDMSLYQTGSALSNIRTSFPSGSCESDPAKASPKVLLVRNIYNELGQLVDKQLHSSDNGSTFKQSVDYRYNIRGWLTSINNAALSNNGTDNDDVNDLFGMNLAYNNTDLGTGNEAMFNGNISAMTWSSNLGRGSVKQRAYNYAYDTMNRIKTASHKTKPTNGLTMDWTGSTAFSENGYKYDLNGNIRSLTRNGASGSAMDRLSYDYGAGTLASNRLRAVNDTGDPLAGFKDGNTAANDYTYDANGNMQADLNKDVTYIAYNHLNLPDTVKKSSGEWMKYVYDATGRKLQQLVFNQNGGLVKKSVYEGEYFYENDSLKFLNTEEGRVVLTDSIPEFQYHLKDHLGNVRMTFTTKDETDSKKATLEEESSSQESPEFINYDRVRIIHAKIFDNTHRGGSSTANNSIRLSGSENEKIGLAKSLSVMPGDTITAEVYGKYFAGSSGNDPALVSAIATIGTPGGSSVFIDGAGYSSAGTATYPFSGLLDHDDDDDGPRAYLNYMVFDRNFNPLNSGFKRLSTGAREHGDVNGHTGLDYSGTMPERIAFENNDALIITEPGYVYIWLSNEEETPVEVFFDDFKVTQIKSPVIQTDDYYPFGLTFNEYQRESSLVNNYQYNGKEKQDELGINWLDYGARMYMPDIGRWGVVDSKSMKYKSFSPYNFALNNPVFFLDPDGNDVDLGNLYSKNDKGEYINKRQIQAFELFASTKVGKAFLTDRAQKGFKLQGVFVEGLNIDTKTGGKLAGKIDANFKVTNLDSYKGGKAKFAGGLTEATKTADGRLAVTYHMGIENSDATTNGFRTLAGVDTWAHETLLHGEAKENNFNDGKYDGIVGDVPPQGTKEHDPSFIQKSTYGQTIVPMLRDLNRRLSLGVKDNDITNNMISTGAVIPKQN